MEMSALPFLKSTHQTPWRKKTKFIIPRILCQILCQGFDHAFPTPSVNLCTHRSNTINIKYASLLSYQTIKHLHVEYLAYVWGFQGQEDISDAKGSRSPVTFIYCTENCRWQTVEALPPLKLSWNSAGWIISTQDEQLKDCESKSWEKCDCQGD